MENPLHLSVDRDRSLFGDGVWGEWLNSTSDRVSFVLAMANHSMRLWSERDDIYRQAESASITPDMRRSDDAVLGLEANLAGLQALSILRRFHRYGISVQLVKDLNESLSRIAVSARLQYDRSGGGFAWTLSETDFNALLYSDRMTAAICDLLTLGQLDSLKRCELRECRKFHVRRGKWCSDSCGSKYRVRNKRKKDKERQMMI